jgi:hypothetical protein
MKTIESGMVAIFPLTQTVAGFDHMPESGELIVRNRAGSIEHKADLDVTKPYIELPAVTTPNIETRWVRVIFTVGGQVLTNQWSYQIVPFLGTTVSADQLRTLLSVDVETLPDSYIDLITRYLSLQQQYPELEASASFDRLVLLTEALRLLNTSSIWLVQSRSIEDVRLTRFKSNLIALEDQINSEVEQILDALLPTRDRSIATPTLLQFVPIADSFSGV